VEILNQFLNPGAIPGHLAYAIIAVSYLLTNIFWLRVAAVVGIGLEVVYFVLSGTPIWTSIIWDTLFILINLVQLLRLLRDRLSLRLTSDQKAFLAPIVGDLDKAQIAQLLRTGEWRALPPGEVLTVEDSPVTDLTFICEGRTEVMVKDQVIAHVGQGAFIGDVSFTTGSTATATVVTDEPSRVLAFDQARLKALCRRDKQIASALYRRLGGGLADKMRATAGRL
jgi:CRP-like cAMP-binding protein